MAQSFISNTETSQKRLWDFPDRDSAERLTSKSSLVRYGLCAAKLNRCHCCLCLGCSHLPRDCPEVKKSWSSVTNVTKIMWPAGARQSLCLCTWHWWGNTSSAVFSCEPLTSRKLERVQRRVMKPEKGLENKSYQERLRVLGLLRLGKGGSGETQTRKTQPQLNSETWSV